MPTGSLVGNAQRVNVSNSIICYVWAGSGTTSAPDATNIPNFAVGVNSGGVAAGIVYHVIGGTWVSTTATVANLYGG